MWTLLAAIACTDPTVAPADPPRPAAPVAEQVRRVSLAIRGLPPTPDEVAAVEADADALVGLVDAWMETPAFGETLRDLHAEFLWTRVDTEFEFPRAGPLRDTPQGELMASLGEGPLRLVEDIITSNRPYGDILTADHTRVDPTLARLYGLAYDPDGPTWQTAQWTDGRPAAGLLGDNGLWLRFRSSDTNYQRERANTVTRAFLCMDFASADIPVVAEAGALPAMGSGPVSDPACSGCHAVLDPVGSFFWGFRRYILPQEVKQAYEAGCPTDQQPFCYPFDYYNPDDEDRWVELGMPEPSLLGAPGDDLADLGALIRAHPAFASCTVRHFAGYLTQTPEDALPSDYVDALATEFAATEDAKALVRQIVLDPGFTAVHPSEDHFVPGVQHLRPEQLARTLWEVAGFRFAAAPTAAACEIGASNCWGEVDLLLTDRYGFRTLAGGISGYEVTAPTPGPTPTRALVLERVATEAAGFLVTRDLAQGAHQLLQATPDGVDRRSVVAEIDAVWTAWTGAPPEPALEDAAWALWREVFQAEGWLAAWQATWTALLQHPSLVSY